MDDKVQRLRDIIVSFCGLALSAPLFTLIAIAIRIESPGPVFFRQIREGKNGEPFSIYKFRSMHKDVPKFELSPRTGTDPRVTKIGRVLRETSLDELPQLLNVLEGSMSLVGPRPLPPQERPLRLQNMLRIEPTRAREHEAMMTERLKVLPGMTGLAQVRGRSALDPVSSVKYDLDYVHRRSFALDLIILWETGRAVLLRHGVN